MVHGWWRRGLARVDEAADRIATHGPADQRQRPAVAGLGRCGGGGGQQRCRRNEDAAAPARCREAGAAGHVVSAVRCLAHAPRSLRPTMLNLW